MIISDNIARMIEELIEESGGTIELKRNVMAEQIGCAPSQINYVIMSRFTPERGYIIESRRGGGGHIRIVRKQMHRDEYLMHFFYAIGNAVEENEARAYLGNLLDNGIITSREALIVSHAISGAALAAVPMERRAIVRAEILRHVLLSLMS